MAEPKIVFYDSEANINKCLNCTKGRCDNCLQLPKQKGRVSKRLVDLTGQRFGRWTVIGRTPAPPGITAAYWLCRCDCGTEAAVIGKNLRDGKSQGCNKCKRPKKRKAEGTEGE